MADTIDKLLEIQDRDCLILRFEKELHDLPLRKAEIETRLKDHRLAVIQAKEAGKLSQADVKKVELEVESRKDKIRKFREQQLQLKNNKDFKAMESEILAVEQEIRHFEDRILEKMESVDRAASLVRQRESELRTEEEAIKTDIAAIDQRGASVKGELDRVLAQRDLLARQVDPAWLASYDRIFKNKKDKALVRVENGSCSGCHMKLPPYLRHDAKRGHLKIVTCEFCGRMLC